MEFRYVHKGQRIEIPTAAFHNAIVDVLRQHMSGRRGFNENIFAHIRDPLEQRRPIEVVAAEDIDPFSIFTITGTNPFNLHIPVATSQKITNNTPKDAVYITNAETSMVSGDTYLCWIVGDEIPRLLRYAGMAQALVQVLLKLEMDYNLSLMIIQ